MGNYKEKECITKALRHLSCNINDSPPVVQVYIDSFLKEYDPANQEVHIIVDPENSFCHPQGELYVPRSLIDMNNYLNFMRPRAAAKKIGLLIDGGDEHDFYQYFFQSWWTNQNKQKPKIMETISAQSITDGYWEPRFYPAETLETVEDLEARGWQLNIWPYHTMRGTWGAKRVEILENELQRIMRSGESYSFSVRKPIIPLRHFYSMFEPEVPLPEHPYGYHSKSLLESLGLYQRIIITGEALSHCALETLMTLVRYFQHHPDILKKIFILTDCSSCITGFEKNTWDKLEKVKALGVNVVKSTDSALH